MGRISKFQIKKGRRFGIAFILSMLLIIAVALAGCNSSSSKVNSNVKKRKHADTASSESKDTSNVSDNSSGSSAGSGSDTEKTKEKNKEDKSKDKSKKNDKPSSSSTSSGSSSTAAKHKVWVPDQGHYEQKRVFKCRCGAEFSSPAEQATHQNNYIAEKRKTNPNFECKGDHIPKGWVPKTVWKVDVPGHYVYR